MDAEAAAALVEIAEEARARTRRQDLGATAEVEARYPEMLEALDWHLDAGQLEAAYRLASALVQFWNSTKRIDDGDAWFARALGTTAADDAAPDEREQHDATLATLTAGLAPDGSHRKDQRGDS